MAPRIVKDFTFSSKDGYSGSAGQTHVTGYKRGGSPKKVKAAKVPKVKPPKVAAPRKARSAQGPALLPPPMPPPAPSLGPLAAAAEGMGGMPPAMGAPVEPSLMNARNGGRSRKR